MPRAIFSGQSIKNIILLKRYYVMSAVVWCSGVLEHVSSPPLFLKKLYILLRQDSLLILYVPTIPALPWLQRIPGLGRYVSGYKAQDHINAFVPSTLRFTCEQAGFR